MLLNRELLIRELLSGGVATGGRGIGSLGSEASSVMAEARGHLRSDGVRTAATDFVMWRWPVA